MWRLERNRYLGTGATLALIAGATLALVLLSGASAAVANGAGHDPATLPSSMFVAAPPGNATGPDDITYLPADDESVATIWTAYQNGINPNGTAGSPGGPTQSVVAEYAAATGKLLRTVSVTGKVDGLTADPANGRVIATVNEDNNSAFNLIDASTGAVTHFTYDINPSVSGNGGTDSIAVWNGEIYVSHSNPENTAQSAEYRVWLDHTTHVAHLVPLFWDNSVAQDVLTGQPIALALTDPDTNFVMPNAGERFAGSLALISQGDGKIIFSQAGAPELSVLNLTDNVSGNVPPADGLAVATSSHGTLYVVDGKTDTITALSTDGWPKGTIFIGEPNDNNNPLVGTLNPNTGVITPLGNHFADPKGILFVPDHSGHHHHHHHHDSEGNPEDAAVRGISPELRVRASG